MVKFDQLGGHSGFVGNQELDQKQEAPRIERGMRDEHVHPLFFASGTLRPTERQFRLRVTRAVLCQPGKLRVQAQAGLVDRFRGRRGKLGYRWYGGLGLAKAQVAAVGTSAARAELTALLDGFVEEDLHG